MADTGSRVLVVDDEFFFLEAIDEILSDAGFQTELAESGETALEAVADPSIGVVVLDVRLPDLDGIQVLASIRELRPELPVIMLSASTDQEIVLEALRLGASDYLGKPLHDEELALAVGRALEGFEANADRRRLRGRIDRLVESMERLSQMVRFASVEERVPVLRQGIVDAAASVFEAERVSLMLADVDREWLNVVATRGSGVDRETMTARRLGDGPAGWAFADGNVLCVADVDADARFKERSPGRYESAAFAVVPLVCLGVSVGVLCLTEPEVAAALSEDEANVLRLLGMQVAEFLAADPEVERCLQAASVGLAEGTSLPDEGFDADAELARTICDVVASEAEPARVLRRSLGAVSTALGAAPVSLLLLTTDGETLEAECEVDGGIASDRSPLPVGRGLTGLVCQTGGLVAVDDPEEDARFDPAIDTAADGTVRSFVCVPLKLRSKVVGVVRVFLEPGRATSARTAEVLAAVFSAAIRNVLLYRSLLQSIEEVAEARRSARS